jgi:uncharacterized surface protein with fasciclin (FAS1) repeats
MKLKTLFMTIGLGFWMNAAQAAPAPAHAAVQRGDLVTTLGQQGSFKTLAAALKATDLITTLESNGPFTVLAPTDAAFAKLGQATLNQLLANPDQLKSILLYHVVPGNVSLQEALRAGEAETVNGAAVDFSFSRKGFLVNDSRIVRPNVQASNGIIHVIDSVLIPPTPAQEPQDIVSIALADDRFETLVAALKAADLVSVLQGEGPFTVFAPTDDAFAKLGADTIQALLADKDKLTSILLYHVVAGAAVDADTASQLNEAATANGQKVKISFEKGMLKINDSLVVIKDIKASNGIIHVIDTVLIPE